MQRLTRKVNLKDLKEKEVKRMKRIGKVAVTIMAIGIMSLLLPNMGWCYKVRAPIRSTTGALMQEKIYDSATPTVFDQIINYVGGLVSGVLYSNGNKLDYQRNGGKLISSVYTNLSGNDYKAYFDTTEQEMYSIWLEYNGVTYDADTTRATKIFLGDTESTTGTTSSEIDTNQERDDMALQNVGGVALRDSGLFTISSSNEDTHSKFNFAEVVGKLIRSLSLDTDGNGARDRNYTFGLTTNLWATGSAAPVLYTTEISQLDTAGNETSFSITGKVQGSDRTVSSAASATIIDPSAYHDASVTDPANKHWDPAITISGTLSGNAQTGFYVTDGNGNRHDLDVLDENLKNQLSQLIGRRLSVTGDHADDDLEASLIFLQNYTVTP